MAGVTPRPPEQGTVVAALQRGFSCPAAARPGGFSVTPGMKGSDPPTVWAVVAEIPAAPGGTAGSTPSAAVAVPRFRCDVRMGEAAGDGAKRRSCSWDRLLVLAAVASPSANPVCPKSAHFGPPSARQGCSMLRVEDGTWVTGARGSGTSLPPAPRPPIYQKAINSLPLRFYGFCLCPPTAGQ